MIDSAAHRAFVDERLAQVIAAGRSLAGLDDPLLAPAFDEIERLVSAGGKRTRPEFVHLGWLAAGGTAHAAPAVDIGAAFEILHVSALVHDDVIDGASLRRGEPTVHVQFAGRHRDGGWAGEQRRVSEGAAVLVGNIAAALADSALGVVDSTALDEWNTVKLEVNAGQYLDLVGSASRAAGEDHATLVMLLKTARYTVERPLRVGASATGNADASLLGALSAYGQHVGIAFQLRDDVLGVFGDRADTGKPVGDDLREGKATVLLALARERADAPQSRILGSVGDPGLGDDSVAAVQQVMRDTGALAEIEDRIALHLSSAVSAANVFEGNGLRGEFVALAERAAKRVS